MTMRIAFIGCVQFSLPIAERLLANDCVKIAGIVTRAHSSVNADFLSLSPLAVSHGIPYFEAEGNDQSAMKAWLEGLGVEAVICVGWSYLLSREILDLMPNGVIGYHPALLPRNRGRHPIIWALALGLRKTGSTFFVMNEEADAGDIVSQVVVKISESDNAATLYVKLCATALEQIDEVARNLASGQLKRTPQDTDLATVWRKRSTKDGEIDWRMTASCVHNLVRALTLPYVGAHCVLAGNEIKVWRTEPAGSQPAGVEPGKVLAVENGTITVNCCDGALRLLDHEFETVPAEGDYL